MTRYALVSFIICLIIATVNIVSAFIWGATLFSVVCCWVCYMAFALLIYVQEKANKHLRDQLQKERKIMLDFVINARNNIEEQDND